MKKFYPIERIDLRFQVNLENPEKIQLFEQLRDNSSNTRFDN